MRASNNTTSRMKCLLGATLAVASICLLPTTSRAYPDPPINMAPTESTVFQWTDIPQNQNVPIRRAVFDRGGYQLYDTAGETIVVPFTNNNLYVMKFAVSPDGSTYFVNTGNAPVLYLPSNGYIENATVAGAYWYPFTSTWHPVTPVYVGIAPSWSLFVGMGWYPHMHYWGGYWGNTAFVAGGFFTPSVGLFFNIGGHPYYGWNSYHSYYAYHPGYIGVGYWHRDVYGWAARPYYGRPAFTGYRYYGGQHSVTNINVRNNYYNGSHQSFGGGQRTFVGSQNHSGWNGFHGATTANTSGHTFNGGNWQHSSQGFRGVQQGGTRSTWAHQQQSFNGGQGFHHTTSGSFGGNHATSHNAGSFRGGEGSHHDNGHSGGNDRHDHGQ